MNRSFLFPVSLVLKARRRVPLARRQPPVRPAICLPLLMFMCATCLLGSALSVQASTRPAHGVFPQSDSVRLKNALDPLPVVITTFGFLKPLSSHDWNWVCEDVTGETFNYNLDFPFELLANDRWLLGTTAGLWWSQDHCTWTRATGIETLYITQIQRDVVDPDRIWASSSTGEAYNGIWYSEDDGESFQLGVHFGTGTTVRGFMEGKDGGPWFVVGLLEGALHLWYAPEFSSNASDWQVFPIPLEPYSSVYPLEIDMNDPEVAWLRISNSDTRIDSLVRFTLANGFSTVFSMDSAIDAFASGPAPLELFVGGRQGGLYHSTDGVTFGEPSYQPQAGCLKTYGNRRFQCTNDLADGIAVIETDLTTGKQKDVLWFGDVHEPETCPEGSQSAQICDPYWESVKATAWLDLTPVPTPTPEPEASPGCGCGEPASEPSAAGLSLPFLLTSLLLRKRAASKRS